MHEEFKTQGTWWYNKLIIKDESIVYDKDEYMYIQLASIKYISPPSKYQIIRVKITETNGKITFFGCFPKDKERFKNAVSYANEQIAAIHGNTLMLEEFENTGAKSFVITNDSIIYGYYGGGLNEIYYTQLTPIKYHEKDRAALENTTGTAITKVNGKTLTLAYNFEDKKRFEAAVFYANEQIAMHRVQIEDYSIEEVKEYKMKCNVCGNVYCYTQKDLEKNAHQSSQQNLSALAGLGFALSGNYTASGIYAINSKNASNSVVDYTKCPKCNSIDIHAFTDEEWGTENPQHTPMQVNTSAFSSADELKKFKELLDSGVITQEEFEIKKKQLLGLEY